MAARHLRLGHTTVGLLFDASRDTLERGGGETAQAARPSPGAAGRVFLNPLRFDHALGLREGDAAFRLRAAVVPPEAEPAFLADPACPNLGTAFRHRSRSGGRHAPCWAGPPKKAG